MGAAVSSSSKTVPAAVRPAAPEWYRAESWRRGRKNSGVTRRTPFEPLKTNMQATAIAKLKAAVVFDPANQEVHRVMNFLDSEQSGGLR